MTRRWLWLYRPTAPSVRAQSIQVLNMCHAMASLGHLVTLAVDPPVDQPKPSATEVLESYGLEPHPNLSIKVLPGSGTMASLAFRVLVASFVLRFGGNAVIYSRSKKYSKFVLDTFGERTPVVQEVHEVDSLQAAEAGNDSEEIAALEAEVFGRVKGVVANCPGTLKMLRSVYDSIPKAISAHNATHPNRVRPPSSEGVGVGYVGSVRGYKDIETLAKAAALADHSITLIGADGSELSESLQDLSGGSLSIEPPIPHRSVPDRLSTFRVLLLPLGPGLFGEQLTSPLKLWDYLASGVPIVAANFQTVTEAAPEAVYPYTPGDPQSLADAINTVASDEVVRARLLRAAKVRTWADRAREVADFVDSVLGDPS